MPRLAQIINPLVGCVLLIVFSVYSQPSSSAESFTYAVPLHWQEAPEHIRAEMEALTRSGLSILEGQGTGHRIEDFNAYSVRNYCVVFIYNVALSKGNTSVNELDEARELAKNKFEAGKRSGKVKDIISILSEKVGDWTGNVFEWISSTNKPLKRIIDTSWSHPSMARKLLNVSAQCTEKMYPKSKDEFFDVVRSASVQQ